MEGENKLRVYLETSFVSYLTGGATPNAKIAADQAYTRQWWECEKDKVDVFVSGYTLSECEDGNPSFQGHVRSFQQGAFSAQR